MRLGLPSPVRSSGTQRALLSAVALRWLAFMVLAVFINRLLPLGTSLAAPIGGALAGVYTLSQLAFTRLRTLALLLLTGGVYLLYQALLSGVRFLCAGYLSPLTLYYWELHLNLTLLAALIAAWTTWLFWRFRHYLIFEALGLGALIIQLLSSHRHYRFDLAKFANSLAWYLGLNDLAALVLLGGCTSAAVAGYLYALHRLRQDALTDSSTPARPTGRAEGRQWFAAAAAASFLFVLLCLSGLATYRLNEQAAADRLRNGVGTEKESGLSPLSFSSALGSSKQPAALVRLEGDYPRNPYSPMIYFREAALSQFNGQELVIAERRYDRDVSGTTPLENFTQKQRPNESSRTEVVQSVYLLTEHQLAFAIDYPSSIKRLAIPAQSSRFNSAYRATSLAPAFQMENLEFSPVGDPAWSPAEREHYLQTHPDPRYAALAGEIGGNLMAPIQRVQAVVDYLSANATYTLTPNHPAGPQDDPVAPFLFGDLRGYCVHFAHAEVYLLRALGIPARIGTGYLTDLSQARDGHILLRMNDRHAWAEVYVRNIGWVPYDIKPEKIENHAESPVDQNLLEELMGLLQPGEEILPDSIAADEESLQTAVEFTIPEIKTLLLALLLLASLVYLLKLYLLLGWALPGSSVNRLRRAYRALLVLLSDCGWRRRLGETRLEFARRLAREGGPESQALAAPLVQLTYARQGSFRLSDQELTDLVSRQRRDLSTLPRRRLLSALISPWAALRFLGGGL